jgi:hypothetical protein
MKTSDLILYGGIAAAAYYAWTKGLFSSLFSGTTGAAAPLTTGQQVFAPGSNTLVNLPSSFTTPSQTIVPNPNPATNPAAAAAASSYKLGDIYTAMQYYSADIGNHLSAGQWNNVLATVSNILPPDTSVVFPLMPNEQMTLETYWAGMAPWLAANKGMSGVAVGWA